MRLVRGEAASSSGNRWSSCWWAEAAVVVAAVVAVVVAVVVAACGSVGAWPVSDAAYKNGKECGWGKKKTRTHISEGALSKREVRG
jgi:hypothetical protein